MRMEMANSTNTFTLAPKPRMLMMACTISTSPICQESRPTLLQLSYLTCQSFPMLTGTHTRPLKFPTSLFAGEKLMMVAVPRVMTISGILSRSFQSFLSRVKLRYWRCWEWVACFMRGAGSPGNNSEKRVFLLRQPPEVGGCFFVTQKQVAKSVDKMRKRPLPSNHGIRTDRKN